jgi:hypothetical protein
MMCIKTATWVACVRKAFQLETVAPDDATSGSTCLSDVQANRYFGGMRSQRIPGWPVLPQMMILRERRV